MLHKHFQFLHYHCGTCSAQDISCDTEYPNQAIKYRQGSFIHVKHIPVWQYHVLQSLQMHFQDDSMQDPPDMNHPLQKHMYKHIIMHNYCLCIIYEGKRVYLLWQYHGPFLNM